MIITDKFIVIHKPKTGGSFVSHVLHRFFTEHLRNRNIIIKARDRIFRNLHLKEKMYQQIWNNQPLLSEERLAGYDGTNVMLEKDKGRVFGKHGGYGQIPKQYCEKPIVSIMRNPFDQYVSHYEFRWWQRHPLIYPEIIRESFSNYPDLSFEEMLELTNDLFLKYLTTNVDLKFDIGFLTWDFIHFYFENPNAILEKLNADYIDREGYEDDMCDVRFLHTENLNQELYDFLLEQGYQASELQFILDEPKKLPEGSGRTEEQLWENYYTTELRQYVMRKERLLFKLFPEYAIGQDNTAR